MNQEKIVKNPIKIAAADSTGNNLKGNNSKGNNSKGNVVTDTRIFETLETPEIFKQVHNNIRFFVLALNKAHIENKIQILKDQLINDEGIMLRAYTNTNLIEIWHNRETPYKYKDLSFGFLLLHNNFFKDLKPETEENLKYVEKKENLPLDTNTIERIIQANIYINMPNFMKSDLNVNLITKITNSGQIYTPSTLVDKTTSDYQDDDDLYKYQDVDDLYKKFCHFFILKTNIDTLKKNNYLTNVDIIEINNDYHYLYDLNSFLAKMNDSTKSSERRSIKFRRLINNKEKSSQSEIDIDDKNYFDTQIKYFFDIFYHTMCGIFPDFGWTVSEGKDVMKNESIDEMKNESIDEMKNESIKKIIVSDVMVYHDKEILPLIECFNHISKYINDNDARYKKIFSFLKIYNNYLGEIDDYKVEQYKVVRNNKSNVENFGNIISPDIFNYELMHIKDKINLYRDLFEELGSFKLYRDLFKENHEEDIQKVKEQFSIIDKINDDYINNLVDKLVNKVEKSSLSDFFIILIESENINFSNKLKLHEKLKEKVNEAAIKKYNLIIGNIRYFVEEEKHNLYHVLYAEKQEEKIIKNYLKEINFNLKDKYFSFYVNYLNIWQDICFILDNIHGLSEKFKNYLEELEKKINVLSKYKEFYEEKFLNIETINKLYQGYYKKYFKTNHNKMVIICTKSIEIYEPMNTNADFYYNKKDKKKKISKDTIVFLKSFSRK